MQFHVRPGNEFMVPGELGYAWAIPLATAAAQAAMESRKEGGDGAAETEQNAGMPGREASSPRQPSAVTTVSPSIQASISPMISPVMSQVQSSPGSSISANPMQYMPGGMSAEGGGSAVSPYGNYAAPGIPSGLPGQPYGSGFPPQMPYTLDPMTGTYRALSPQEYVTRSAASGSPVTIGPAAMTEIPWLPLAAIAAVGLGAMFFMQRPRKRAA